MKTWLTYFPSGEKTWTRRLERSATYTRSSLEILTAWTGIAERRRPRAVGVEHRRRRWTRRRRRRRSVIGRITEGAPHSLEGAGLGVEHDQAAVAIAVGHERFIRFPVDEDIGRSVDVGSICVALALTLGAELLQESALGRELQQHVVGDAASANPDDVLVVDGNAVLGDRPVIALTGSAPRVDELSAGIEFEHRRRGPRLQCRRDRARTMENPDVVTAVHRHRRHHAHHPVVGQLRPERVDFEDRHAPGCALGQTGDLPLADRGDKGKSKQCEPKSCRHGQSIRQPDVSGLRFRLATLSTGSRAYRFDKEPRSSVSLSLASIVCRL